MRDIDAIDGELRLLVGVWDVSHELTGRTRYRVHDELPR